MLTKFNHELFPIFLLLLLIWIHLIYNNINFLVLLQGGKGTQYYVGAAQTLPRGMYSDRNKNVIGEYGKKKAWCMVDFEIRLSNIAVLHVVMYDTICVMMNVF